MKDVTQETCELVKQKRAEVEQLLKAWAEEQGLPAKGIQLNFSLHASSIPCVVHISDPVTKQMMCKDFFTAERFATHGMTDGVTRIINTLSYQTLSVRTGLATHTKENVLEMSLQHFVEVCTEHDLLRMPNFGRKSLNMVDALLKHYGFTLHKGY